MERKLISNSVYNRLPEDLRLLTSNYVGRERDIILLSSLGVLSNCLPNIYGVYGGDKVYANLFVIIIAPPASGKGVMNHGRVLIEDIHNKIFNDSRTEYYTCEEANKKEKENKDKCKPIQVKILPANTSTAEMYNYLNSSNHGLIIIESEADSLGQMLKNDWSNYSDVLRKIFHHETISMSRKLEKVFVEVKEPKLSVVISGTPEQLKPIIQSRENGLFSRFLIYNFDEVSEFKNVFAQKSIDGKRAFKEVSNHIYNFYGALSGLQEPIEFSLTTEQQNKFLKRVKVIHNNILTNHSEAFISNLYRHGLILFRIAMILTAIRNRESLLKGKNSLVCSNVDFINALNLMKTLLRHSQYTFNTLENGFLSIQDEMILDDLNSLFERKKAIEVGKNYDVPKRTIDDKLVQWQRKRVIKKVKKGTYRKL